MGNQTNKKMHHAWKIVIACILMKLGLGGITYAMMSNFMTPIVEELNCQVSELAMYTSVNAISMALLYTVASRLLTTKRPGLIMGFASLAEVVGVALMSTYRSVYMFYLSGLIIGVSQAFTGFVALPIMINMWFRKNAGTVLGTVVSIGSAASVAYNLLSAQLIISVGWRSSYLILAAIGLVVTVPAVFLFIRSPSEMNCQPYGADETVPDAAPGTARVLGGLTKRQAFRAPFLYVAWLACIFYSYGSGVSGYVTPFSTMELGQTIRFGANAGMFMHFGAILCSLILGRINDKFGVKAGLMWGAVTTVGGYAIIFLSFQNPLAVFPAAFILGLGSSMYSVQCPLLARSVVGSEHYSGIWSVMMVANSLIGGGLYSSIGLFYDKLGSYSGAFIMGAGLYVGAMLLGLVSLAMNAKRIRQQQLPSN